jgi:predicted unusual protein kinase regulating ubiquinone biosynthesis (AarF/ABC1/UbiB family)
MPVKKKDNEANRLTGRVARYAKVTAGVSGVAVKLVGQRYFGLKLDKGNHAAELKLALGSLRGPLMKVAQILATIPDAVPEEYAKELAELQANAPSMGWPFVKRRMKAELGEDWESKFKTFTHEAVAAASLGQVHQAGSLKGQKLACKLQYPDMRSAVEADLGQLKIILGLFERIDPAFRTRQVHDEISARLREELDYTREAAALKAFATMLKGEGGIAVPEVMEKLSTGRLLTMTWREGKKVSAFYDAALAQRNEIAEKMFRAWYVPFYKYGIIHGDPHPGNYTIAPDGTLNLLDFGCVRVFPPKFVTGVIALYRALAANDEKATVAAYKLWGFKDLRPELIDILNHWARFIYGPILDDRVRMVDESGSGEFGRATARKVHFSLRDVGGVEVPREFVFMDRAAVGLGSVFFHLKAKHNWCQMFNDLIADYDEATLAKRQKELLKGGLPSA